MNLKRPSDLFSSLKKTAYLLRIMASSKWLFWFQIYLSILRLASPEKTEVYSRMRTEGVVACRVACTG